MQHVDDVNTSMFLYGGPQEREHLRPDPAPVNDYR
jgi:hypothetical protein